MQRLYFVETSDVDSRFDGTYSVGASKNNSLSLNSESSSKEYGVRFILWRLGLKLTDNSESFHASYPMATTDYVVVPEDLIEVTDKCFVRASGSATLLQSQCMQKKRQASLHFPAF